MKNTVIATFIGLVLVAAILALSFSGGREHDPKDISYWAAASRKAACKREVVRSRQNPQRKSILTTMKGWPNNAPSVDRSAREEAPGHAIPTGGRGNLRITVSGWRRSASDNSPPATFWRQI